MRSYSNEGLLYMYQSGFQNEKKDAVFLKEFCLNLPKNVQFGIHIRHNKKWVKLVGHIIEWITKFLKIYILQKATLIFTDTQYKGGDLRF